MKKSYITLLLFALLFSIAFVLQMCKPKKPIKTSTDGSIRGYVYAEVRGQESKNKKQVFLPMVKVQINDSAGTTIHETITDYDGSYATITLTKGKYKICLKKEGFVVTCYDFEVNDISNHPGPLRINYDTRDYLYGTVLQKDKLPGFYRQIAFGIDFHTDITARAIDGTEITDVCNVFGEYLLMGVKMKESYEVTATCQNAVVNSPVTNNTNVANFTLPNTTPIIKRLTAYDAGSNKGILRTSPGAEIKLEVKTTDAENHALTYKWYAMEKNSGFVGANSPTVNWQLPNRAGRYNVYAIITDDFGGVAYKQFSIVAGDETVQFTGVVKDIVTQTPIANALVTINGTETTQTNAKGYFSIKVPQGNEFRYVLNVEKVGYSLHSSIYFNDAINKEYVLVPSTTETFDPKDSIVIIEKEDKFTRFRDDKQRNYRVAAKVAIPANAIIDGDGNKVTSDVTVSLRTIDLYSPYGLMPGDFGAEQGGQQKILESYGAIDVQIRDKANPEKKYKIDPTMKADIEVPIFNAIQGTSPAAMTLWDYDERRGVWLEIGVANKFGNIYKAKTNKFSALNVDVAFSDATCIVLQDNPNRPVFTGGNEIDIRVTVPSSSGGAPKVKLFPNINSLPQVIVRLPASTLITIEVIRNDSTIRVHNVTTGGAIPGPANLDPQPPYNGCTELYILPDAPLPDNPGQVFLNRVDNDSAYGMDYYRLIGALDFNNDGNNNDPITFAQWKARNFFNPNSFASDDASALYFNAGDLGFWRGMHQKTQGTNVAYYVSNYASDVDGANNSNIIATVCMEYSPIVANDSPVIKFYVFDGAGDLVNFADLDGGGVKFVPGLCIVCHGGQAYDNTLVTTPAQLQAFYNDVGSDAVNNPRPRNPKFLAFDPVSFNYSSILGYSRNEQEDSLRQLNNALLSTQTTKAIKDYVRAFYNNTPQTAGTAYNNNAAVSGWNINAANATRGNVVPKEFYTHIVGPSCRTCHLSRTSDNLWFDDTTKFVNNVFPSAVCGANKYMPNSKVTFINLWESLAPYRPEEIRKYLQATACE